MKPLLTQLWPQFSADAEFTKGYAGALVERVEADRRNKVITVVYRTLAPVPGQLRARLRASLEPLFPGFAVSLQGLFDYTRLTPEAVLDLAEELKEEEFALASLLGTFPQIVQDAAERREPFYITRLVTEVAKAYNKFYYECRILGEAEGVMQRRLGLTRAAMQVLRSGLALLGIRTVDKM